MALRAPLVIVDGRVQQLQVGDTLSDVQPLDADLTAIAALSDTGGWAKRTGADTWAISTPTAADVSADPAGTAAAAVATHESTYSHANYNTAYGWGDHASGGYLKADGTVPLTGDWTTGIFSIIGSDHWYMRADSMKMYLGAGDDCSIMYDGSNMVFNSQEVGTGGFYFANGTLGVGTLPVGRVGVNVAMVSSEAASSVFGLAASVTYGSAGSGNTSKAHYGFQCFANTSSAYDGNITNVLYGGEFVANHYGTGTLSYVWGGQFRVVLRAGAGDIVDATGGHFQITDLSSVGAIANAYGLYVESINVGTTLNYAIYTNAGQVWFGDAVVAVGVLQAGGYKSSDGTAGATTNVAVAKVGGGTRTFTFKNGLYISYADS